MARPSIFTDKLGLEICNRIADGESLRDICLDAKMPTRSTVHLWILDGKHKEFSDQYEKAVNTRAENMFDELEKIADNPDEKESPMRSRLRVDTRKWYLSKIMPKKYGDKVDVTTAGEKLPTPIMQIPHVQRNDSDKEDTSTDEED